MTVFTLAVPVNVGTLTNPVNVSSLTLTGIGLTTTPSIAPLGTAALSVTITDPVSGWQENISYLDASVLAFFAQAAPTPPVGATVQDVLTTLVFTKLMADGKLPAGSIATT